MVVDAAAFAFCVDGVVAKPIARRTNFASFCNTAVPGFVSVAGRFSGGTFSEEFTTIDGGSLRVLADAELTKEIQGAAINGFVEVIGTKEDGLILRASAVLVIGERMDVELWDQAVQMMHQPQLRSLFEPSAVALP